jgi:hypothetical protein
VIHDLQVSKDDAGFPVVTWTEDRGVDSPQGGGRARVECRIMKHGPTGELLFVARGTVRDPYGKFEEGKSWARLRGFSVHSAESLYRTKGEIVLRQHLGSKNAMMKWALSDSAVVALAEFLDDRAIHINCADASQNDMDWLHATLVREFVTNQPVLVGKLSRNGFTWPVGDDRVMTYDPGRTWWSGQAKPGFVVEALGWAIALGLIGGGFALISWMVGLWRI